MSDLLKKYLELNKKSIEIGKQMKEVEKEWLKENCPFKVGDVFRNFKKPYLGNNAKVEFVMCVRIADYKRIEDFEQMEDFKLSWRMCGSLINKDGTARRRSDLIHFDEKDYLKKTENSKK